LRETRWNLWVSLVNLETQRYLSVEEATDKLKKIKNIKVYNLGKDLSRELDSKDKEENDSLVDLIVRIPCPKKNKVVPYLQEFGNLTEDEIQNFERAIKAIENYRRKES
jgi:predicted CopG family antitoxin